MSLNQLYDDLKPDLEVGSTSNYKFNNIRTKTFQTTTGRFDNVITTLINGLPVSGGGLPPITPADENSVMSVKSGSATWTDDIIIADGGSLVVNPTADINCYGPSTFYNDVNIAGPFTFMNFYGGAQANFSNGGVNMTDSQNLLSGVSNTVNNGATYINNHNIGFTGNSLITADLNVNIIVPNIKFNASGPSNDARLSFYKTEVISMQLSMVNVFNAPFALTSLNVYFTRIGRVIQMNIKNERVTNMNGPFAGQLRLSSANFPSYLKPDPLFSSLVNISNTHQPYAYLAILQMQADGTIYISPTYNGAQFMSVTGDNSYVTDNNESFLLGLDTVRDGSCGGISVS
jgi:hypothetical protein